MRACVNACVRACMRVRSRARAVLVGGRAAGHVSNSTGERQGCQARGAAGRRGRGRLSNGPAGGLAGGWGGIASQRLCGLVGGCRPAGRLNNAISFLGENSPEPDQARESFS